jgi:acetyltransferase-like isoleucine patch superfamily enzyme
MQTEMSLRRFLGIRRTAQLSLAIRPWLRIVSYAPLQSLRLLGLTLAGAKIGGDIVLSPGVEVLSPWRLSIGSHTNIARHVRLDSRGGLTIGDNVNISEEAAIWTAEHDIQSPDFCMTRAPVAIGNYVWVCFRSIILPGVSVGQGSVVASGSVVTKDVPPFSVVAGAPARVIGTRNRALSYRLGNPNSQAFE